MNKKSVTTIDLNKVAKKMWQEPQMVQLEIKETKTLQFSTATEDGTFAGFFGGAS